MGTGIMGAIPISFRFDSNRWIRAKEHKKNLMAYAAPDFFDFYKEEIHEYESVSGKKKYQCYEIKPEMLLSGFKDFYFEFHNLIKSDEGFEKFDDRYDAVVALNNLDRFMEYFDDQSGYTPMDFSRFSALHISCTWSLLVYNGSYKAALDVWTTFTHMELMLRASVKHPLAKVVRFGMSF